MTTPFVGRERELAAVRAALETAPGGLCAVLLTGEAGIGKSRLLSEVQADVEARGWRVLAGRADVLERQIPYAFLVRAVEPVSDDADPEVAALAREVLAALDGLGGGQREELASSFGQVCGQVTRLWRALLDRRPLAIVLDDVDALDEDTLSLLAIVLRRVATSHVVLLGTSRLSFPSGLTGLDTLLGRLEADARLTVIPVGPIEAAALTTLVTGVLGPAADSDRVDAAVVKAEGNPFFAIEIAGSLAGGEGPTALTRSTAIVQRFAPLDPRSRSVLRAVAVLGRASVDDLRLLAAVAALPEAAVASGFDELVAAGLLMSDGEAYDFTHDLVREAVYADIGPAEKRRLHQVVADQLLAARKAGRRVEVLALARHISEAGEPGDDAVAVLTEAGDRARSLAPGSAAAFYERALDLVPADHPARARILSRRCRALVLATRATEAVQAGREALGLLTPSTDERDRTATAVIGSLFELGRIEEALAVADAELAAGSTNAVIQAQRPLLLWFMGRLDEALTEWQRARQLPVGRDGERILVLGQLAFCAGTFYQHQALVDIADELQRLARHAPPTLQLYAVAMAGYMLAMNGFPERSLPLVEQAEMLLEDAGGTPFRANILVARCVIDWLQGRWDEALDGAVAAATELEAAQLALHVGAFHAAEIDIRTHRGLQVSDQLLSAPVTSNMVDLRAFVVAGFHQSRSDLDAARAEIEAVRSRPWPGTAYLPLLLGRLAEIELAQHPAAAEDALAEAEKGAAGLFDAWTATGLARTRAVVHGDATAAAEAAAVADSAGLAFERARAQLVLGELDTRAEGSPVEALVAAYRTFQDLGADRHRRQAAALLTARGAKVPRRRSTSSGLLTKAEMAIARLVQQGMRNKEIATFLHYSPRTVEVYLSRIYAKLGVSSRLELARALDARALEPPE